MASIEKGLPRSTFAKLLPHSYLLNNLDPTNNKQNASVRSNGRTPHQARAPSVNLSSLSHAHGSSLVRMGDTTVICGVRGETVLTSHLPNYRAGNRDRELLDYDLLVPNIELSTGSAPQFLPGGPPSSLAQTLSTRVFSLLHSAKIIDPSDLRIWFHPNDILSATSPANANADTDMKDDDASDDASDEEEVDNTDAVVMAYWVLYIDIFFISFDGNAFDAAWAALITALHDTKLPRAHWDPDREMVICTRDPPKPLSIASFPIATTAVVLTEKEDTERPSQSRYWLLLDPDRSEENLCKETVTAVVDLTGSDESGQGVTKVLSLSKSGGSVVSPELLRGFVTVAEERWKIFRQVMPSPRS